MKVLLLMVEMNDNPLVGAFVFKCLSCRGTYEKLQGFDSKHSNRYVRNCSVLKILLKERKNEKIINIVKKYLV